MPREWHDLHSVNKIEDPEKREFYRRIVADKKPYFMRYVYPSLMKDYNTYMRNTKKSAIWKFQMSLDDMRKIPQDELTEDQVNFLHYCDLMLPVSNHNCVMNRICKRFEEEFDGHMGRHNSQHPFDYTVMKGGAKYTKHEFARVSKIYMEYNSVLKANTVKMANSKSDPFDTYTRLTELKYAFLAECSIVCPNRYVLCDLLLDVCYSRSNTKRFVWDLCGNEIVENLLSKNGYKIRFPMKSDGGDISYGGEQFALKEIVVGGEYEFYF